MIRVNLAGIVKKPVAKAAKPAVPTNILPIVHLVMLIAAVVGGYLWYASLTSKSTALSDRIGALQEQQRQLDVIIKQDQVYEPRKMDLENRIRVIEDLKKNQLSPVVVLDALAEAIDRTHFVWLSTMS